MAVDVEVEAGAEAETEAEGVLSTGMMVVRVLNVDADEDGVAVSVPLGDVLRLISSSSERDEENIERKNTYIVVVVVDK